MWLSHFVIKLVKVSKSLSHSGGLKVGHMILACKSRGNFMMEYIWRKKKEKLEEDLG